MEGENKSIFDNMTDDEFEKILKQYGFKYEKVEEGKGGIMLDTDTQSKYRSTVNMSACECIVCQLKGVKGLIKVENIERPFEVCTSCHSEKDVKEIKIGKTERQTTTIRLCRKCREEMVKRLNS